MVSRAVSIYIDTRRILEFGTGNNPYFFTIYISFQERAAFISHRNTAKLAIKYGDSNLAQIRGVIASDEKRHEAAYTKIASKLFKLDPNDIVLAFANTTMRRTSMPAHCKHDGYDNNLFHHFCKVTSCIGVYTATDYREILEHLEDVSYAIILKVRMRIL
ncbi:stearoyl-[acyl-carrier-protein] 9-desaturase 5, chloroplastic-like [Morus notabilis]|uniref:stearoyl-[acyl-carrier-protein] 9-desaturase 5, chloroplastic-like n=1 Tax=Morus notabilis TaxID=981085 RepID=UPI000CED70DB|nr:stearoyl-[acyl-carrier-protein] 9-desaturase 5, chloroplastic-like [Morus notabilis]